MMMRNLSLLFLLLAITSVAPARRSSPEAAPAKASPPGANGLDDLDGMRWAYPYGWGLENIPKKKPVGDDATKKVKEVKRAPPKKEDVVVPPKTGWFGVKTDKHAYWQDVEEVLDGFE